MREEHALAGTRQCSHNGTQIRRSIAGHALMLGGRIAAFVSLVLVFRYLQGRVYVGWRFWVSLVPGALLVGALNCLEIWLRRGARYRSKNVPSDRSRPAPPA